MTESEAFKKAIELYSKNRHWVDDPLFAYITPIRICKMFLRIADYHQVNHVKPENYRQLHKWEKEYYSKEQENEI